MNRTKKFFYNSVTTAFLQIVLMLAGFITSRLMLKFYGSEINGLISSINQFIVYLNLVEAGLSHAAIYALYKPLADNDHKTINGIVAAAKKLYTQSGYIFVSLTTGLAVIYPMFVKSDALTPLSIGLLVLIVGVNGALEFFTLAKYRVILSADQRIYVVSLASIVNVVASTLIIVVLVNRSVDIVVLRLVAVLSIFLRSFILMFYVKAKYKYINYREAPNFTALNKRWDALYLQILGAVQIGIPVVILTVVTRNLKIVSVYSIYNMVTSGLDRILSIFISGLSASFGDIIVRGEKIILQKAYREFELFYYSLITVVYSIAFITIMPFIRMYTSGITDINYDLPLVGFLFVTNGLLSNIKTPQGMLVISAGMFKETKLQTTIQGAIVVIFGTLFTLLFGIMGVLIGSIFSNIYRDIDLLFFISRNVTKLPVRKTAYRIIRIFMCIISTWIPFLFIELHPTGYLFWLAIAAVTGVYAVFVVAVSGFIFDRDDMISIAKRIKGMVR